MASRGFASSRTHVDPDRALQSAGLRHRVRVRRVGRELRRFLGTSRRFAQVWTMKDGKAVAWTAYPDRESALAAVSPG
jgi:ketosteroid isomerase-like protein